MVRTMAGKAVHFPKKSHDRRNRKHHDEEITAATDETNTSLSAAYIEAMNTFNVRHKQPHPDVIVEEPSGVLSVTSYLIDEPEQSVIEYLKEADHALHDLHRDERNPSSTTSFGTDYSLYRNRTSSSEYTRPSSNYSFIGEGSKSMYYDEKPYSTENRNNLENVDYYGMSILEYGGYGSCDAEEDDCSEQFDCSALTEPASNPLS